MGRQQALDALRVAAILPLRSGYEAALDVWTSAMWPLARQAAGPLPLGVLQVTSYCSFRLHPLNLHHLLMSRLTS